MTENDDDYMTPQHRALLRQYYEQLREAKKLVEAWWSELIGAETGEKRKLRIAEVQRRWPNGPASHPYVIGVIVKHAKACDALNRSLDRSDRVPVNRFIIDALDSSDTQDLAKFTETLTYWPLGTGEDGRIV